MPEAASYTRVLDLRVGSRIYLYGNRTVRDVSALPAPDGPQHVLLSTDRGEFVIDRNALISGARENLGHA